MNECWQTVADTMQDGFMIVDSGGTTVSANKVFEKKEKDMKNLQEELKRVEKNLRDLAGKLDKISKELEKAGKKPAKGKPVSVKQMKETAFAAVLKIINRSKKGVTTTQIMEKTGFDRVKVANIVAKSKKLGKIKVISKGVYLKA